MGIHDYQDSHIMLGTPLPSINIAEDLVHSPEPKRDEDETVTQDLGHSMARQLGCVSYKQVKITIDTCVTVLHLVTLFDH